MITTSNFPFLSPMGDGELLGHYILRNAGYTSSASVRRVFRDMLNRKPSLYGMPNGVGRFHEVVGHVFGSLDMLLNEHTELNWYCRGLPPEKYFLQRRNLIEKVNGPVRLCHPDVTLGGHDGVERYCPECDAEHQHEYGFKYLHRELCAPYVEACLNHGLELRWRGKQGRLFDVECCHPLNPGQLGIAVEFARRTAHCLNTIAENGPYTKADTLRRLKEAGYLSETGRLAVGDTVHNFIDKFGESFSDERVQYMCSSEKCIVAALRNLMRPERAVFPLYCILLSWMAEEQVRTKLTKSISLNLPKRRVLPQLTADQVRSAMIEYGTLTAASDVLGVNMKKLTSLCLLHGVPISKRTKILTPPLLTKIHAAYDARMTPGQVMKKFDISLSTAHWIRTCRKDLTELKDERVHLRNAEDKATWEKVLLANLDKTTTTLKKMHYSLWARLRRNSKTWLEEHSSITTGCQRRRSRTWPEPLKRTLNKALQNAASSCEKNGRRPLWKTLGRLHRSVGITESQIRRLHQQETLDELLESNSTFIDRRLQWADPAPGKLKAWKVARKAGLRKSTISRIQQSLTAL